MASSRRLPAAYCVFTYGDVTRDYQEGELSDWEGDTDIDLTDLAQVDVQSPGAGTKVYVDNLTPWGGAERPGWQAGDTVSIGTEGGGAGVDIRTLANPPIDNDGNDYLSVTVALTNQHEIGDQIKSGAVLECYDDAASYDDNVLIAGATTTVDFFRVLKPATGEGHTGTYADGVTFINTAAADLIDINENYSQVQDLVLRQNIDDAATYDAISLRQDHTAAVGCLVYDCANAGAGDADGIVVNASIAVAYVINCVVSGGDGHGFTQDNGTGYYYNCVSYDNAGDGMRRASGIAIAKNCISENNITSNWNGTWTKTTCYDSHPGFNDPANHDFTWISTDWTGWMVPAFGADLSADGNYAFDDDIDGDIRSSWSAGVDDFEGSAGSSRFVGYLETVASYGLSNVAGGPGGGGCDYTEGEFANWEANTDIDLVSGTVTHVLECYDEKASFDDTFKLDMPNEVNTSAKYFRIVRPAGVIGEGDWEGHNGTQSVGFTLEGTAPDNVSHINEHYSQIQDIIIKSNMDTGTNHFGGGSFGAIGEWAAYVGCLVVDMVNTGDRTHGFSQVIGMTAPGYLVNCLFENCVEGGNSSGIRMSAGNLEVFNCTSTGNDYNMNVTGGTGVAKNVCASNHTVNDWLGVWTKTTCTAEDVVITYDGADDFHTSDADVVGQGTDLSVAHGGYSFNDDIDGDTRS